MSSSQIQEVACAYNGYAWGGCSTTRKAIGDWSARENYITGLRSWVAEWICQVDTDAAKTTEIAALRALAHPYEKFGIGRGRALEVTDAVISSTTITSATGGFTAAMVGLPISVVGKGTTQITARTDTNTITVSNALGDGTGLTAFVGNEEVRVLDDQSGDGFSCETEIEFPEDDSNTGLRWRVRLTVTWRIAPDQARGCNAQYRRIGNVDIIHGDGGFKTVILSGVYTAGGGATAPANYSTYVGTWLASVLSDAGITSSEYAPDLSKFFNDDEKNEYQFTLAYRQLPRPQYGSGYDLSSVRKVNITFGRSVTLEHGKTGSYGPVIHTVSWSSAVDSATAYTAHAALYTGTIKPYIVAQLLSLLGGDTASILQEEGPTLDQGPTDNRIHGVLTVLLRGSTTQPDLVVYDEQTRYESIPNKTYRKRHDGKPSTYHWWDYGDEHMAQMTVTVVSLGSYSPERWSPERTSPPFADVSISGSWHLLGRGWDEIHREIGKDRDSVGTAIERWRYQWTAGFIYVANDSVQAPSFAPGELEVLEAGGNVTQPGGG